MGGGEGEGEGVGGGEILQLQIGLWKHGEQLDASGRWFANKSGMELETPCSPFSFY